MFNYSKILTWTAFFVWGDEREAGVVCVWRYSFSQRIYLSGWKMKRPGLQMSKGGGNVFQKYNNKMFFLFCFLVILTLPGFVRFSGCIWPDYCVWEHVDGIAVTIQYSLHCLSGIGMGQGVITFFIRFKPCCSNMSCHIKSKRWSLRCHLCCYYITTSAVMLLLRTYAILLL